MPNYIRTKQIDQTDLSGFFIDTIGAKSGLLLGYISGVTLNETVLLTGNQNVSGIKTFLDGVNLNNIDNLNLSGVDITITSGTVILTNPVSAPNLVNITYNTGNQTISGIKTFAAAISAPNLVYNTGNQTISGDKIFKNKIRIGDSENQNAIFTDGDNNLIVSGYQSALRTLKLIAASPIYETYIDFGPGADGLTFKSPSYLFIDKRPAVKTFSPSRERPVALLDEVADQFPAWTGARRYAPLDLLSVSFNIPASGTVNYFPFLIKKNVVNPVACVEMTTYLNFDPKIDIGIYSGHYGFQNAKLIASGSITGSILNTGIYRTTLNGTFNKGPYIVASMLKTGQGSTFRILSSHGFREHFGINTGSSILHGNNSTTVLTNILAETGASILPQNIGSGEWYATAANAVSPLVFLEY